MFRSQLLQRILVALGKHLPLHFNRFSAVCDLPTTYHTGTVTIVFFYFFRQNLKLNVLSDKQQQYADRVSGEIRK